MSLNNCAWMTFKLNKWEVMHGRQFQRLKRAALTFPRRGVCKITFYHCLSCKQQLPWRCWVWLLHQYWSWPSLEEEEVIWRLGLWVFENYPCFEMIMIRIINLVDNWSWIWFMTWKMVRFWILQMLSQKCWKRKLTRLNKL